MIEVEEETRGMGDCVLRCRRRKAEISSRFAEYVRAVRKICDWSNANVFLQVDLRKIAKNLFVVETLILLERKSCWSCVFVDKVPKSRKAIH